MESMKYVVFQIIFTFCVTSRIHATKFAVICFHILNNSIHFSILLYEKLCLLIKDGFCKNLVERNPSAS